VAGLPASAAPAPEFVYVLSNVPPHTARLVQQLSLAAPQLLIPWPPGAQLGGVEPLPDPRPGHGPDPDPDPDPELDPDPDPDPDPELDPDPEPVLDPDPDPDPVLDPAPLPASALPSVVASLAPSAFASLPVVVVDPASPRASAVPPPSDRSWRPSSPMMLPQPVMAPVNASGAHHASVTTSLMGLTSSPTAESPCLARRPPAPA